MKKMINNVESQDVAKCLLMTIRKENAETDVSWEENPHVMSSGEKRILCTILPEQPLLSFPLQELPMRQGPPALEYLIPEPERERVLRENYPFTPCPQLTERRFDLHENRFFVVKDYKLIRERNRNFVVSPYYSQSGGMVIDWMDEGGLELQLQLAQAVHDPN